MPAKFIRPPWEKQKNPAFKYVFTIERSETDSSYPYCILQWGMEIPAVQVALQATPDTNDTTISII